MNASELDVAQIRDHFPILQRKVASGADLVYLDNAASTQRPAAVIDAMSECYRSHYANVHRGLHTLSEEATSAYESARHTVAAFVNAASHREVIFTSGTTAGINLVAHTWGRRHLQAGDVILLPISEHHANIVPWQQLCDSVGCRIEWLMLGEDFLISEQQVIDALNTFQPKIFAFGAASNTLGTEVPVARWTELAHQQGATVLVDAAQAIPHHAVDVQAWDADFVAFSGHKVCGPTGIGVLHGKEQLLESLPPFLGGGGMIRRVTKDGFDPAALPEKFEAGTPPIAEAIGLEAAVHYVTQIGLDRIHRHEQKLASVADEGLRQIPGLRIIGPTIEHRAGIVTFVFDDLHAHDLSQALDIEGIAVRAGHHCTMPLHESLGLTMSCRASFYLYNTVEEAEKLVEAVRGIRDRFDRRGQRRRRSDTANQPSGPTLESP